MLIDRYDGDVPRTMEALLSLPGIGRKIANLVLGDGFGIPGVVVDTHCGRVARRIGLTDAKDPAGVERDLMAVFPRDRWIALGHLFVAHGRHLCDARNPLCRQCPLSSFCRHASAGVT
jgi:endonuclease-3